MRVIKSTDNLIVSNTVNSVLVYIGDIFDSIEVRLGNEDYVIVDARNVLISINRDNIFLTENDKEGIEILLLKRVLSTRFQGRLADLLANREIIKIGLSDKLLYYYYVILSSPREINNLEDFVEVNIPWISFYPYDKDSSKILKDLVSRYKYKKEFETETENLFNILQRNLYTSRLVNEAEKEWLFLCK